MQGISAEEIIKSLGDSASFGSLKKLLKQVDDVEVVDDSIPEAQLKRQQRAQHLESARKSIGQFDAQIKQNRRSIKVDLIQEETATRGATSITSTTALVSSTEARTDFEKEFRQAIEESGLSWTDNTSTQLPATPVIQEDRERRQMARVRTLVRAEQIRARRLKKIKSKSYRTLLRKKEMKGMHELIAKLDKEDPETAEQVKAELEKKLSGLRLNRQRQARLKWSQAAQRFGGREMRGEISKQAQAETDEKRELIRAIKGKTAKDSEDDDSDDSSSGSEGEDDIVAKIKKSINAKVIYPAADAPQAGLMGMKFMREATTKQRNQTVAEAEEFIDTLDASSSESESDAGEPVEDATATGDGTQQDLVASLFSTPVETVTPKAKKVSVSVEKPANEGDALPGWGDWVGEGIKPRKNNKRKAAPVATPVSSSSAVVHMLEEEKIRAPLMKYQVTDVPYPYKSKAEYAAANSQPIGPDWMALTAHSEAIRPKICARIGAVVPPIKLAKHLDADKRAKLIDAWDNRKRTTHTKARFL